MVLIKRINADNPEHQILKEAACLLLKGEVVVCPTDTCYIFAANAIEPEAIKKVFDLKGRSLLKPIHVVMNTWDEAEKYAYLNEAAKVLARKFLPGPLTLVLRRKEMIPPILVGGRDTIGIRIPNNRIILALAAMTNRLLTATSANISGKDTPYTIKEVEEQLGSAIQQVALILDQGPLAPLVTSTVVDLTVSPPQVLREGPISPQEIFAALKL